MDMILAIIIFVIVYILIATDKVDKTVAVLLGAVVMLLLRLVPFEKTLNAIDLNVIFLLIGMMTSVHILSKTGFFEWIAIGVAKSAKGEPLKIMLFFIIVTAVASAFLDNVTSVVLLAPVTILVAAILEISPIPFLIFEALASNIGGTATLIGDPPNMVIGSQAHLSFNSFIVNLTPDIIIVLLAFVGTVYIIYRRHWNVPQPVKARLEKALPHLAILDKKNMVKALAVLGLIFIGFFTQDITGLEAGMIALSGSVLMILLCKSEVDSAFMKVEWGAVFFFIGLFMIISALDHTGAIKLLAQSLIKVAGTNLLLLCLIILGGSAIVSAILDNIPFVITMIPLIKQVIASFALVYPQLSGAEIQQSIAQPLWWSLALGACLGGNGTLIGASANVVIAKISEKNNYTISFRMFFKYGFPFMIQSIVISGLYIWLRFFLLRP